MLDQYLSNLHANGEVHVIGVDEEPAAAFVACDRDRGISSNPIVGLLVRFHSGQVHHRVTAVLARAQEIQGVALKSKFRNYKQNDHIPCKHNNTVMYLYDVVNFGIMLLFAAEYSLPATVLS